MVYYHNSISVCNSVDQSETQTVMENSMNSSQLCTKSRHSNHVQKNRKTSSCLSCSSIPVCDQSRSAWIDVVISIAVVASCGYLLFPYVHFVTLSLIECIAAVHYVVKEEVISNPIIYGSIGASTFLGAIASWILILCTNRRCGKLNCKGLRKAVEFDIQLETEECVKNSSSTLAKDGGLFELPHDHHRELEAELKKMAPRNGRAVLVFRARCGCSHGRLEVPGPRKQKKIKK